MKWLYLGVVFVICVGVCSAQVQFVESDFWRNPTGKDISWLEISKRMGVTENQAKAWGPVNRPNGLKSGEWTAKHDLGIGPWFAWYYHSSDQVEGGLNQQMKGLPKDKLSIVKDLVNGPKPEHGKLIWGQVLSWMKFQQKDKKKADYVESVVCLWQDMAKAGRKISELPTFVWTESGIGYAADCYNLYAENGKCSADGRTSGCFTSRAICSQRRCTASVVGQGCHLGDWRIRQCREHHAGQFVRRS
jgi:hypothetical protein